MKYGRFIFAIILFPITVFILYSAKNDPDLDLQSAQRIFDECVNGKKPETLIPDDVYYLPDHLKKVLKQTPESAELELFKAYCRLSTFNPTLIDTQLIEIIGLLSKTNHINYFIEFLKMANFSDNLALAIYTSWGNPNIRNYFTWNKTEEIFGSKYSLLKNMFNRIRIDMDKASYAYIEKRFIYAGTDFQMPWTIPPRLYTEYSYPAMAYIAKMYNNTTKYEHYKLKSISQDQLSRIMVGKFEYIAFAAKIFSAAGDPALAVSLIETLPPSRKRNLLLKRTLRTILNSKGGIEAVRNSSLIKSLEVQ